MDKKYGGKVEITGEEILSNFDNSVLKKGQTPSVERNTKYDKVEMVEQTVEESIANIKPWPTYADAFTKAKQPKKYFSNPFSKQTKFTEDIYKGFKTKIWESLAREPYGTPNEQAAKIQKYSLLRDAHLIHLLGYERFINICMGETKGCGWGGCETETPEKFAESSAYKKYEENEAKNKENYEEIKKIYKGSSINKGAYDTFQKNMRLCLGSVSVNVGIFSRANKRTEILDDFVKHFKDILKMTDQDVAIDIEREIRGDECLNEFQKKINKIKSNCVKVTTKRLFLYALDSVGRTKVKGDVSIIKEGGMHNGQIENRSQISILTGDNRRYLRIISLIFFIYFLFVLFESYRTLSASMTRIREARENYLHLFPDQIQSPADESFLAYIFTFFKVMYESVAGIMITLVNELDGQNAFNTLKDIFKTSAQTTYQNEFEEVNRGYFSYFNTMLTGYQKSHMAEVYGDKMKHEVDSMFLEKSFELRTAAREIRHDINSSTMNVLTAFNGFSFSIILLLHSFFPKTYNVSVLTISAGLLSSSYSLNHMSALFMTGGQIALLIAPSLYLKIRGRLTRTGNPDVEPLLRITDGSDHQDEQDGTLEQRRLSNLETNVRDVSQHDGNNIRVPRDNGEALNFIRDNYNGSDGGSKKSRKLKKQRRRNNKSHKKA